FDVIKVGAAREEVEFELGKPASSQEMSDGKKVDSYKYEVGNSPNPGRASIYGYYDLATIGLAEPIFTIIELVQGDDEETQIVYGPDDRVLEVHGYTPPPVSAELKADEEAQEQHKRKRPTPKTTASDPVILVVGMADIGLRLGEREIDLATQQVAFHRRAHPAVQHPVAAEPTAIMMHGLQAGVNFPRRGFEQ